ncbi:MAG: hypothetical protein WAL02_20070 [Rhodoplanes sp.]
MSRAAQARTKVGSTLIGLTFEGSSHESLGRGCLPSEWAPHILKPAYDERPVYAKEKSGVTVAMAMTEKQGGSDLRATITTAAPVPQLSPVIRNTRAQSAGISRRSW